MGWWWWWLLFCCCCCCFTVFFSLCFLLFGGGGGAFSIFELIAVTVAVASASICCRSLVEAARAFLTLPPHSTHSVHPTPSLIVSHSRLLTLARLSLSSIHLSQDRCVCGWYVVKLLQHCQLLLILWFTQNHREKTSGTRKGNFRSNEPGKIRL
ncbi:hypothetical protein BZA77DRAFT_43705 [Pyronema omphalodes]|nr:hypothetical protein BZA77DRAFT_43705 [Pyronema omphalodes]